VNGRRHESLRSKVKQPLGPPSERNRPVQATAIWRLTSGGPTRVCPKVVGEMAAPELDGPPRAPSPLNLDSTRVRMEAWRTPSESGTGGNSLGIISGAPSGRRFLRPAAAEGRHLLKGPRRCRPLIASRSPHRGNPPTAPHGGRGGRSPPAGRHVAPLLTRGAFSWKRHSPGCT